MKKPLGIVFLVSLKKVEKDLLSIPSIEELDILDHQK